MFSEYLDHLRLTGRYSFTFKQVTKDLAISTDSSKSGLYRLKRQGKLITPAKGFYVIVPPERKNFGSISEEDLVPILMQHLKATYYISLLSAGLYHGATHQKPNVFQVISNKRFKDPLKFGKINIDVIYKKSLIGLPIQDKIVKTGYLKIATPELVAFDLFLYPKKSGGLNHIATVLCELVENLDAEKLIELAKFTGKNAWLQRLGYILERVDTMEPDKVKIILDKIEQYLDGKVKSFVPLASELPKVGKRIKKWMIIENTDIESDL